ncbi:MAG: hypothetical protein IJL10_01525 [Synergistaceae bacterium]|nr:hypothetical protein [Synergistaceae bacterium]
MSNRKLLKGNVAFCYGAMAAKVDAFFGYPITPQNEVPEYLSAFHFHGRGQTQSSRQCP